MPASRKFVSLPAQRWFFSGDIFPHFFTNRLRATRLIASQLLVSLLFFSSVGFADAPVIHNAPITSATVGSTYTYDLSVTDADNDPLTYWLHVWPSTPGITVSEQYGHVFLFGF